MPQCWTWWGSIPESGVTSEKHPGSEVREGVKAQSSGGETSLGTAPQGRGAAGTRTGRNLGEEKGLCLNESFQVSFNCPRSEESWEAEGLVPSIL